MGVVAAESRAPESMTAIQRQPRLHREHFALFRSAPEGLPLAIEDTLRRPTHGADWGLGQRLDIAGRARMWVLPARESICLIAEELNEAVSMTCTSITNAIRHGIFSASVSGGRSVPASEQRFIAGVVPDHVRWVEVNTPGSDPRAVSVTDNAFALRDSIRQPPESIELLRAR